MPGLAELSSPGFVSRSAAFAAVSYYALAYATQLLPVPAAAGLIETGLVSRQLHHQASRSWHLLSLWRQRSLLFRDVPWGCCVLLCTQQSTGRRVFL